MIRTQSTVLVQTDDLNEAKNRFPKLLSTFQAGFRSILNVPLFAKGQIIGALLLRSVHADAYNLRHLQLAERVGRQIAGAIANSRLYAQHLEARREVSSSAARFQILSETAGRLLATDNPQGLVNDLCARVMNYLDCHAFFNFWRMTM